jgi:hypothetical protein
MWPPTHICRCIVVCPPRVCLPELWRSGVDFANGRLNALRHASIAWCRRTVLCRPLSMHRCRFALSSCRACMSAVAASRRTGTPVCVARWCQSTRTRHPWLCCLVAMSFGCRWPSMALLPSSLLWSRARRARCAWYLALQVAVPHSEARRRAERLQRTGRAAGVSRTIVVSVLRPDVTSTSHSAPL